MAGERLGSAMAVRSAVSQGGRESFGGSKSSFGSVKLINFSNSPSFPRVSNISEAIPLPQFEPLRAKHLNVLARSLQAITVNAEATVGASIPETGQVESGQLRFEPKVVRSEPEVKTISEVKSKALVFGETAPVEPLRRLRIGEVNLSVQSRLTPIEQAAIRMSADRIRARLLRPRSQAIPMVSAETVGLVQPQVLMEAAPAKNEQILAEPKIRNEEASSSPVRTNVVGDSLAARSREVVRVSREKAVVDYKVNRLRINALITTRDKIRALGKGDLRDEIVKESGINDSREFRSSILDLVDRAKGDGTQPRTGDQIVSNQGELTNQEIEVTVFNHTAVRNATEGDEVGKKQLYEVATLPKEPYSAFDEEWILPKKVVKEQIKDVETVDSLQSAVLISNEATALKEKVLPEEEAVEIMSRSDDLLGSRIASAFEISLPRTHREEVVFN